MYIYESVTLCDRLCPRVITFLFALKNFEIVVDTGMYSYDYFIKATGK